MVYNVMCCTWKLTGVDNDMHGAKCVCEVLFVRFIQTLILKGLILQYQSTSKKHMYCFTGDLRQIKDHSVSVKNSRQKANLQVTSESHSIRLMRC